MGTGKIPRSFGTHDGTFHADEVTACALLILFGLIDENKIHRTRDRKTLAQCEYVCDVGGIYDPEKKLFDHHQAEYRGPLSSAGMILLYLKNSGLLHQSAYNFFNESLILGVDANDNGKEPQMVGYCSYSDVIANFAPILHDPPPEEQDLAFLEALRFTLTHLQRLRQRYDYMQSCKAIVEESMAKNEVCLVFDKGIPWLELFFALGGKEHLAEFVVMPSGGHWTLRCIPPSLEDKMNVRTPLPEDWAGLLEDDLKKVSGIPGAIFCHKGRFISVWETKADAMKALEHTLETTKERK